MIIIKTKRQGEIITVIIGQNVVFISPKILSGDWKRNSPKTV